MPGFLGRVDSTQEIQIIGAGFAGLITGYYLKQYQIPFKIYEKAAFPGGKIKTQRLGDFQAEEAAHAFFLNQDLRDVFRQLGLTPIHASPKLKKLILKNHQFTSAVGLSDLTRLLLALPQKVPVVHNEMSVYEFFSPLLGDQFTQQIISSALTGIYATDCRQLNFVDVFKSYHYEPQDRFFTFARKLKKARVSGGVSASLPGGMQEFINTLANHLKDHIEFNSKIETLDHPNCIICTDATSAAKLLQVKHPELSQHLHKIQYQPVTSFTVISKFEHFKSCFGALIPPSNDEFKTMGILNNFAIFPAQQQTPHTHSYTFIMTGSEITEQDLKLDLDKLNLSELWNQKLEYHIKNWRVGIPIYNLARHQAVDKIDSLMSCLPHHVALFGNYTHGISLREMTSHAKTFVKGLV